MIDSELKKKIIDHAKINGLSMIRVIPAEKDLIWPSEIKKRIDNDPQTINYWDKRGITSDPIEIMADAKSLIVSVYPYSQSANRSKYGYGEFSDHYYFYTKGHYAVNKLAELLNEYGYRAIADPPLPFKMLAYKCGLGYFGKNGLIHNEKYGSWFTIHVVLTNAIMPYDAIKEMNNADSISDCGSCMKCINTCPTGAIDKNGAVVISKCLRYHMLTSDIIPLNMREAMGNRILGCISCQLCCPKNNTAFSAENHDAESLYELFNVEAILREYKKGMKQRVNTFAKYFGANYARAQRILSMAVIAAGNIKDPLYIPLLKDTLYHQHTPIRVHSAWALGKIGGAESVKILQEALLNEKDPIVLSEIRNALAKCLT